MIIRTPLHQMNLQIPPIHSEVVSNESSLDARWIQCCLDLNLASLIRVGWTQPVHPHLEFCEESEGSWKVAECSVRFVQAPRRNHYLSLSNLPHSHFA